MYTLSAHACAYTLYTHAHTWHTYTLYMHAHLCIHSTTHSPSPQKPHEQALSPPFLCGLSTREICLWSRRGEGDQGADRALFFASSALGREGGAAGVIGLMCPQPQEGRQGPPSGSCSGLGAPGLLQHSSACQTSTLLEIRNTQPWFPEDWRGATGPSCRASREPGLPCWVGLF